LSDKQVANLHFPAGVYSFYAVDDTGWYYRAPRPVIQHNRTRTSRLRGYIFYAGALTHVGDLSHAPHVLH
jgi:hypothetical protein